MAGHLLFNITVPAFRLPDGQLALEDQACNGLRLWAENWDRLTVLLPVIEDQPPPPAWVPMTRVGPALDRIALEPLPEAWTPLRFLRRLPAVRRRLRALIAASDYRGFAIGGLVGDWGAVACREAHVMGRPFYVWTDRVESAVARSAAAAPGPWKQRLRARLEHRPMAVLERRIVGWADLGLFHGRETYDAYAPFSRNPRLVHDIHLSRADHIPGDLLAEKLARAGQGPLRIAYVGRADPMKGPLDWVAALAGLARRGADFTAEWLGDGADLPAMRRAVADAGLGARVHLRGFVRDRGEVLAAMRGAHVFLFCHKTPESPRCLIEALASGTPILGYDGAFARDLIDGNGGGLLVPRDDTGALARALADLAADRGRLAGLIAAAARDGQQFDDAAVFAHRSRLIRDHLPAPG